MKKHYLFACILLSVFVVSGLTFTHALEISGDSICGGSKVIYDAKGNIESGACTLSDIKTLTKNLFIAILAIGLPALVIFISYRLAVAWFARERGDTNALHEASNKIMHGMIGFVMLAALFGGVLLAMFKGAGVREFPLRILELIFSLNFIPHAFAETKLLENPLMVDDLYDFILSVLRLVMRFFIYPAFIVIWVWTGFSFVIAEGNPEALKKAKTLLVWAFGITVIVMMLQGFLFAVRASVDKIFGGASSYYHTVELPDLEKIRSI